jgi:hypothetical protein
MSQTDLKMKILRAEDLNELKELGYQINLISESGILRNPIFINPYTFWICQIYDGSKKVAASLYKYVPRTERKGIKRIRY